MICGRERRAPGTPQYSRGWTRVDGGARVSGVVFLSASGLLGDHAGTFPGAGCRPRTSHPSSGRLCQHWLFIPDGVSPLGPRLMDGWCQWWQLPLLSTI